MTTIRLRPRPEPATLVAWQFNGQPLHDWPTWVKSSCKLLRAPNGRVVLRHDRRSGAQAVYPGEWLVKDLDGGVCFYTDSELTRAFEPVPA